MCFDDSPRPARRANLPRFTAFVRLLSALASVSMTHHACFLAGPVLHRPASGSPPTAAAEEGTEQAYSPNSPNSPNFTRLVVPCSSVISM